MPEWDEMIVIPPFPPLKVFLLSRVLWLLEQVTTPVPSLTAGERVEDDYYCQMSMQLQIAVDNEKESQHV